MCGGGGVAERAGLRTLWLSAFVGSNPTPRISFYGAQPEQRYVRERANNKDLIKRSVIS